MRRHLLSVLLLTALAGTACSSIGDVSDGEHAVIGQAVAIHDDVEPRDVTATYDGYTWCVRFSDGPPACDHQIDSDDQPGVKQRDRSGTRDDGRTCASEATSTDVVRLELAVDGAEPIVLDPIEPALDDEAADFHVFAWCGATDDTFGIKTSPVLASDG